MADIENNLDKNKGVESKRNKQKKIKTRTILVVIALVIFVIGFYVTYRTNYLETFEIGENYIDIFMQNMKYRLFLIGANFVFVFVVVYITNSLIKKGLKSFFEEEKKEMPKLPNKSLALIISLIISIAIPDLFLEKLILFVNNAWFGISDPIFNMDIGFYMFQAPLINTVLYYLIFMVASLSVYTGIYYIISFNVYFDGIDGQTLKNSTLIKHLLFNVMLITVLIVGIMLLSMQNIVLDRFLNINDTVKTGIIGAGLIESTIKLWGYRVLGVVIIISVAMAIKFFKKSNFKSVIKSLAIVPVYLVGLFIVMIGYKTFFVNGSELDKEKSYITTNIDYTKTAYNLKIEEIDLQNVGTITNEEADLHKEVINNIPVVTHKVALNNLLQTQTSTGYYTYNNAKPFLYKNELSYIAAREINSANTTYNSKADEYTHGFGAVLVSANKTDDNGNAVYISKDFENKDIKEPRIYYGMQTNSIITISDKNEEFDYPKTSSQNATYKYDGEGGIVLNFLDKLAVSINKKSLGMVFSNKDSKILLNRNIIERAKKVMPYLLYDENPYLVISDDGKLYWVIDAYTVSNEYPYSQKTRILHEGNMQEINYIRNSAKVIINAYDGETTFYITDKTDPIIMVYNNMYKTLFKEQSEIPKDIEKYFTYPEFLYKIQSKMLTMYHDVSADVLYRANDIWQIASYSNTITTTAKAEMSPIYTMVKTTDSNENKLGLVLTYNLYEKESLNAYLVGIVENRK